MTKVSTVGAGPDLSAPRSSTALCALFLVLAMRISVPQSAPDPPLRHTFNAPLPAADVHVVSIAWAIHITVPATPMLPVTNATVTIRPSVSPTAALSPSLDNAPIVGGRHVGGRGGLVDSQAAPGAAPLLGWPSPT